MGEEDGAEGEAAVASEGEGATANEETTEETTAVGAEESEVDHHSRSLLTPRNGPTVQDKRTVIRTIL